MTSSLFKRRARLFSTGFTMGIADLIPGVSGGTIALLFGIYDELLYSIKLVTGDVPRLVLKGKFKQAWQLIPFGFLLPLGIGIASAIFGLVSVISFLLETQPALVWSLFYGLVLGSSIIVFRRIKTWTIKRVLLLIAGFVLTFVIVGLPAIGGTDSPIAIFGTGMIAITAMILPGISGSLIMVLLGQYEIVINAVANLQLVTLVTFAAGAIIGLALFVRLLTWLLKHYHFAVLAVLVGVMLGSLRRIWPWQTESVSGAVTNTLPPADTTILAAIVLFAVGLAFVYWLEKRGIAKEHNDIDTPAFKKEFAALEKDS